ncbi:HDOD domain-containing protein [Piscinibacter sakaiensis]|uniref:HDOD domain-containing protein n=1 Tax=Piscinibacter sakaiensis TaxID=1547922 RepID=UPI003AADD14B
MTRNQVVSDARLRLGAVRLPALPEVLLKLLELYRREDASIGEFADLIGADPAMSAKVMTVANSAAYRRASRCRDLGDCLALLGTETVRTIVINQAVFQAMHSVPTLRRADLGPFWRHSLLAAAVAREAARHNPEVKADEAYLAGLLHDIGRLALLAAAPEFFAEGLPADDDPSHCEAERRWLKVDHAEAGAWLIDRWHLSRVLGDGVRYHHQPLQRLADADPLIRIVALAHLVADESPNPKLVGEAGGLCGLDMAQVSSIAAKAGSTLKRTAEQLGIRLDQSGNPKRSTAAAEQLEEEVGTLMLATTVLSNLPLAPDETSYLHGLADAARLIFQFDEVIAMAPDREQRLRRVDQLRSPPDAQDAVWQDFSVPSGAGTRIGDALANRRALFIDREADAAEILSIAEDQLLRRLDSEQVVILPTRLERDGGAEMAALVCVGDRPLLAELAARQSFLSAFIGRAEAARARGQEQQRAMQRVRDEQTASLIGSARDLAHEINNPLAIVQNYLGLLDVKLGTSDALGADELRDLSGDIEVLQQEVARVGRLVRELSSATAATAANSVDINRLIADVVRLFRADARAAGIDLSAQTSDSAATLSMLERDKLEQVLVNLVKNAIEAMQASSFEGGQIVIANGGLLNRDGQLSLELIVRDNGPGMPKETLQRVFAAKQDAGSATSSAGAQARGRGLVIVHQLVRAMGGTILCRSSGAGTRFDMLLPYRQPPASEPELPLS